MSETTVQDTIQERTLHGRVREQLRTQYLGEGGVMLPPLRELSRQLGVNHATVSRALRDLAKEGVVEVVPRKGIFGIGEPRGSARNSTAAASPVAESPAEPCAVELVLFSSKQQSVLDIAPAFMHGIERVCRAATVGGARGKGGAPAAACGCHVSRSILQVPPLPDAELFVGGLRERGVGAVAFLGFGYLKFPESHQESDFIFNVSQQLPTILIGSPHPHLELDCVFSDPCPQMRAFLEQCYAEGLRRFEYLGSRTGMPHQQLRYGVFNRFVMEHGLKWPGNNYDELSTLELAARLKSLEVLPEVVIATNINRALTVILEAQQRGLQLPEQMRVLCFASVAEQAAPILPYATVVLLDEEAVGERAAEALLERLENPGRPQQKAHWETVPAQLISPR